MIQPMSPDSMETAKQIPFHADPTTAKSPKRIESIIAIPPITDTC